MKRISRAGRRLASGSAAAASQPGPHHPGPRGRRVLVVTRQREAERAREPVTGVATHTHPSHSQGLEGCKTPTKKGPTEGTQFISTLESIEGLQKAPRVAQVLICARGPSRAMATVRLP